MTSTTSLADSLRIENERLKATIKSQEDKIKLLATKLVKYLKKGEDEKARILELEGQVISLKEKVSVYRLQLESQTQLSSFGRARSPRVVSHGQNHHQTNNTNHISIESLLLEAKAENQALEDKIAVLKEIIAERDAEIERFQSANKPSQPNTKKLEENIKLIRLNREKRKASSWLTTLESQCKVLQSECDRSKEKITELENEVSDWNEKVNDLQEKNLSLEKRLGDDATCRFSGKENENVISSLQSELEIIKKTNSQLTAKLETKKQTEKPEWNEQILELEKRLKAECEKNAQLMRQHSEAMQSLVLHQQQQQQQQQEEENTKLRQQKEEEQKQQPVPFVTKETVVVEHSEAVGGAQILPCEKCQENATDLNNCQWQLVQVRDELNRIRVLLDTQMVINRDLMRDAEERRKHSSSSEK